jgi:hypothetical protein
VNAGDVIKEPMKQRRGLQSRHPLRTSLPPARHLGGIPQGAFTGFERCRISHLGSGGVDQYPIP